MRKQEKGTVKTIEGRKAGQGAVLATNLTPFEAGVRGILAVLAVLRTVLFAAQAMQGLVYRMETRRRLMADIRRH